MTERDPERKQDPSVDSPGDTRGGPADGSAADSATDKTEASPSASEQTTRASSTPSSEQERIGNYRILEQVGSGGMGEVYRAEQTEPIRRTVAPTPPSRRPRHRCSAREFSPKCKPGDV